MEISGRRTGLRDPYVLDFLNLPYSSLLETNIEQALMDNLQYFLLELGKGVRHEVAYKSCSHTEVGNHPCHWINLGAMNKELP
ncbi:PDDEXK nuclease domain-containing protein [Legionella sp.]|uniref:PDDEXK nuclease domain-containing protein n=1 Tax=Legionella sp. TaxID=459 RepID=UPI003C7F976D